MTSRPTRECRDIELSLGVLVLGALEPAERPAVEAHLSACPRCTAILAELAPMPGLLHRLDPIEHAMPVPPARSAPPSPPLPLGPVALRDRLVSAVRAERARRRRRWATALSAAAILVAVLLSVSLSGGWWGQHPGSRVTIASATDARSAVRADVRLMPDQTGTQLALQLTGVAPEEHCRLVAVDARGRQQVAAAWVATYEGRATVTGHTSLTPHQITRLLVVTDAGRMLVQVAIHG